MSSKFLAGLVFLEGWRAYDDGSKRVVPELDLAASNKADWLAGWDAAARTASNKPSTGPSYAVGELYRAA